MNSNEDMEKTVLFRKEQSRKLNGNKVKDFILVSEDYQKSAQEDEKELLRPIKLPVYDEHFIQHLGEEHCIRPTCGGCRYVSSCQHTFERIDLSGSSNIRRAFIAREGFSIAAIDYSGIELRVAANIAQEDVWINAFLNGRDIHEETARAIFKESYESDAKFKRKLAKCVSGDTKIKIKFNSGSVIELPIEALFTTLPQDTDDVFFPSPINLSVVNEFGDAKKVDQLYYGGEQDTVRIKLNEGTELVGSFAHRVRVIDENGDYVWKHLDEITDKDVVLVYEDDRSSLDENT